VECAAVVCFVETALLAAAWNSSYGTLHGQVSTKQDVLHVYSSDDAAVAAGHSAQAFLSQRRENSTAPDTSSNQFNATATSSIHTLFSRTLAARVWPTPLTCMRLTAAMCSTPHAG
jgi:hypothetical protein